MLAVVERLGSLQFDPLAYPGARNHELVLHARIKDQDRAHLDALLYATQGGRKLVELYNKSLNILPAHELPYFRAAWDRASKRHDRGILKTSAKTAQQIVARVRKEGPLATAAFKNHAATIAWHWAPTREGRAVLEALFETGVLGLARREGNKRVFDLVERLFPEALLARRVTPEEAMRHRLLSRFRGVGLMGAVASPELVGSVGPVSARKKIVAALTEEKILLPVQVEGMRHPRYLLAEEAPLLTLTARAPRPPASEVTFLAPLDPLMWDRAMVRAVFGFDYTWEVYTPEARRVHGYYVLPILFGDRMVGRIEPRLDRKVGTLQIVGIGFEAGFDPLHEPGFPAALARALEAYTAFVGAARVRWARTKIARAVAKSIT